MVWMVVLHINDDDDIVDLIRFDNFLVPMQCKGHSSCFPRGKRAAIVRRYPVVSSSCVQCFLVSVIHRTVTWDYRIFDVRTWSFLCMYVHTGVGHDDDARWWLRRQDGGRCRVRLYFWICNLIWSWGSLASTWWICIEECVCVRGCVRARGRAWVKLYTFIYNKRKTRVILNNNNNNNNNNIGDLYAPHLRGALGACKQALGKKQTDTAGHQGTTEYNETNTSKSGCKLIQYEHNYT